VVWLVPSVLWQGLQLLLRILESWLAVFCMFTYLAGTPTFVLRGKEVRNNMDTAIIFLSLWLFPNNYWFMSFFCIGGSGMASVVFSPGMINHKLLSSSLFTKWQIQNRGCNCYS
jgi:hypothetical protein